MIETVKKRIEWIDFAKFIGIILVIVGHKIIHSEEVANYGRGLIYAFHMPFFFILSGMTCSLSLDLHDFLMKTKKRLIHLVIPYFITVILLIILDIIFDPNLFTTGAYWMSNLDRLFCITGEGTSYIGATWFFIILFLGQSILDLAHLYIKNEAYLLSFMILLTVIGVILGLTGLRTWLSFDIVLAALIFIYLGYRLRTFDFTYKPLLMFLINLGLYLLFFTLTDLYTFGTLHRYFEFWPRSYPLFPLCFITAINGSLAMMYLCQFIVKYLPKVTKPFSYLGRGTLILVITHSIELEYGPKLFPMIKDNYLLVNVITGLIGFAVGVIIILIIDLIKKIIKNKKANKNLVVE